MFVPLSFYFPFGKSEERDRRLAEAAERKFVCFFPLKGGTPIEMINPERTEWVARTVPQPGMFFKLDPVACPMLRDWYRADCPGAWEVREQLRFISSSGKLCRFAMPVNGHPFMPTVDRLFVYSVAEYGPALDEPAAPLPVMPPPRAADASTPPAASPVPSRAPVARPDASEQDVVESPVPTTPGASPSADRTDKPSESSRSDSEPAIDAPAPERSGGIVYGS